MTQVEADKDSPEYWLDDHGGALYRYALARLRDAHRAEEAVQETLLAALQSRDRFSAHSGLRTWLIGILKHKILDQFRRDAREIPLDDPDPGPDDEDAVVASSFRADGHWSSRLADWGDPEASLENGQFWVVLQRCLDLLPKRMARLFVLRELQEEATEQICQEMAITPTNLWTMLYRARMGLRQCLDRNWVGEARG
ncbi:MAG: sigma-70 family RNA polymerase sigma factor [Gammaproteobacteria bacterium]|nr:sigma-70 family RNA polymerase sigma factor [Gammaproteobacteria bacterium]MBU1655066.1 sigma-70 family RNA polymerase sigma factor [Gammaproteobacteria bacterium]MBU1961765.1 sigma-70 family RNA polymerase sigma factor [Gammaproteobacteria bacterium]